MALRAKPPEKIDRRAKVMIYGAPSTGKTMACLDFDNLYYIDTERGAVMKEYVDKMKDRGTSYAFIDTYYDLVDEVRELHSTPNHGFKTVGIDPFTTVFNGMIEESTRRLAEHTGKEFDDPELAEYGKDRKMANMRMRHLIGILTRLDMNVIVTCHEKTQFKTEKPIPDCYSKIDYMFDLVFEFTSRGEKEMASVRKTRHENFRLNETFEWSYQEFAERYGRQYLDRQAIATALASAEQVATLQRLINEGQQFIKPDGNALVSERDLSSWMAKAGVEDWADAKEDHVVKLISFLTSKMEAK